MFIYVGGNKEVSETPNSCQIINTLLEGFNILLIYLHVYSGGQVLTGLCVGQSSAAGICFCLSGLPLPLCVCFLVAMGGANKSSASLGPPLVLFSSMLTSGSRVFRIPQAVLKRADATSSAQSSKLTDS